MDFPPAAAARAAARILDSRELTLSRVYGFRRLHAGESRLWIPPAGQSTRLGEGRRPQHA